jgi:hypothetical protein
LAGITWIIKVTVNQEYCFKKQKPEYIKREEFSALGKGDFMNKLFIILILTLALTGYKNIVGNTIIEMPVNNVMAVLDNDDYWGSQNDLVYHDYGTGIKLTKDSFLIIPELNLNLNDETAIIYAINLINNKAFKLCDYQPMQEIIYFPDSNGVYKIIALISNGEIIDLTPKATIQSSFLAENTNGFILLK